MTNKDECRVALLPCPFCGTKPVVHKHVDRCACDNISCWIWHRYMAFEDWNTRATLESYESAKEPVLIKDCVIAAYGYYSPRARVKIERVKAVLDAAGVKYKEGV